MYVMGKGGGYVGNCYLSTRYLEKTLDMTNPDSRIHFRTFNFAFYTQIRIKFSHFCFRILHVAEFPLSHFAFYTRFGRPRACRIGSAAPDCVVFIIHNFYPPSY